MSRFLIMSVFFLAFLFVSCENKVSVPNKEIPDEDEISDEDTDSGDELISDLKIEENKENSLSCRLTFSTANEKKTFVKYYSDTHKGYKISGSLIWNLLTPTTTCSPLSTSS